jgi:hypothetical protein
LGLVWGGSAAGGRRGGRRRAPQRLPLFDDFTLAPTPVSVSPTCVSLCKTQSRSVRRGGGLKPDARDVSKMLILGCVRIKCVQKAHINQKGVCCRDNLLAPT